MKSFLRTAIPIAAILIVSTVLSLILFNWNPPSEFEEKTEFVKAVAQGTGALTLLIGLWFTNRTVQNSQQSLEVSQRKHDSERYVSAAAQLSVENDIDNMAAMYALRSLARDSKSERDAIVNVLGTYARVKACQHAKEDNTLGVSESVETAINIAAHNNQRLAEEKPTMARWRRRAYLPSNALTLDLSVGRYNLLLLSGGGLYQADFQHSYLNHANFNVVYLDMCRFDDAEIAEGTFFGCPLRGASFKRANLTGTTFIAESPKKILDHPLFQNALPIWYDVYGKRKAEGAIKLDPKEFFRATDFECATLTEASFSHCNLSLARNLAWEQLTTCNLTNTVLPKYLEASKPSWYTEKYSQTASTDASDRAR